MGLPEPSSSLKLLLSIFVTCPHMVKRKLVDAFAIIGSLMNTFIKPVVYAEIGYKAKVEGKIDDPLEGVGFFGRPETFLVLIIGGVTGFIWASVIIIAVCTNLSAIQRIIFRQPENFPGLRMRSLRIFSGRNRYEPEKFLAGI